MNSKTITMGIFCISTLLVTASAFAESEIPTVRPSVFTDIQVNRSPGANGDLEVEVYGSVKYSNDCMVSDQKAKKVNFTKGELRYHVYSGNTDGMICPKIYRPVIKTYLIDRFSIHENSVPAIFVNDKKVY
jgi:hypothetical protein